MSPAHPDTHQGLRGRQLVLAVFTLQLGIATSVLDNTAVALGLPTMARDLGVSADEVIWIINSFQMTALVALLPLAHLGDRVGYKRVYLMGVAVWGLASALAFVAPSLAWLIGARALQGFGVAGILSINMALVRQTWPPHRLGRGIALNAMVVSGATVIGPILAAAILSVANWRWLFAFSTPACALLLLIGRSTLPPNRPKLGAPPPSVLDILLNAGMFISLFLFADQLGRQIKAGGLGHDGLWHVGALLLAALLVGAWHVRRQLRQSHALFPVDLLLIPMFRLSMLTSVTSFAAQTVAFITLPFLLLTVWHSPPSEAGWLLACWPVGTIASAALAVRWIGRFHGGTLGAAGLVGLALGLALLANAALGESAPVRAGLSLLLCGVGFALFQSPNNHTIITHTPSHRYGAASGMIGTARLTGQTLGATLVAMVLLWHGHTDGPALATAIGLASVLALLAALISAQRVRHGTPPARPSA